MNNEIIFKKNDYLVKIQVNDIKNNQREIVIPPKSKLTIISVHKGE